MKKLSRVEASEMVLRIVSQVAVVRFVLFSLFFNHSFLVVDTIFWNSIS